MTNQDQIKLLRMMREQVTYIKGQLDELPTLDFDAIEAPDVRSQAEDLNLAIVLDSDIERLLAAIDEEITALQLDDEDEDEHDLGGEG